MDTDILRFILFTSFLISCTQCLPSTLARRGNIFDDLKNLIFHEKCLGELGCFGNGPPFFQITERPISLVPQDRETIGTEFHFYTPEDKSGSLNFSYADVSVPAIHKAGFDPSRRTVFIIHGFMAHLAPIWMEPMKDALLDSEDCNVFIVDWEGGDGPWYEQSVSNTRVVGAEVALFVNFLQINFGVEPEHVYIIGHSLGAHAAGYAGKRIPNLGRITGMDPAGPYFEGVQSSIRLNSTDALFVDVIHTDAATNRFRGFGTTESIGDVDFWVNGGHDQPGCPDMGSAIWDFLFKPALKGPQVFEIMCRHHRSIELMLSSLTDKSCVVMASKCDTWENFEAGLCGSCDTLQNSKKAKRCIPVGYFADRFDYKSTNHLDLFVKTSEKSPFCLKSGK